MIGNNSEMAEHDFPSHSLLKGFSYWMIDLWSFQSQSLQDANLLIEWNFIFLCERLICNKWLWFE